MKRCVRLEPAAEEVCNQSAVPPLIFQLPPAQGRKILEDLQDAPVYKYPADVTSAEIDTEGWGVIPVYFIAPQNAAHIENVILYIHGAGWVFGSFHTHEKLVREIAARTNSLVVFPEYTLSPEAKYPTAVKQCYFVLSHMGEILERYCLLTAYQTLALAGDSAGGNMAIAMGLISGMCHGPVIQKLLLYYPVTNACFDTPTYCQFAVNYYLYREGMQWFWNQYTSCVADRDQIFASPLRASLECLQKLPDTMIINGEADVLRSEGMAFAEKLRCAGVSVTAVQIPGTIHDFVMLNALDQTKACRIAMDMSTAWLKASNIPCHPDPSAVRKSYPAG